MTQKELIYWFRYSKELKAGTFMEREDYREVVRLNHLVMGIAHEIHNNNMLTDRCKHDPKTSTGMEIICPECSDIPTI